MGKNTKPQVCIRHYLSKDDAHNAIFMKFSELIESKDFSEDLQVEYMSEKQLELRWVSKDNTTFICRAFWN